MAKDRMQRLVRFNGFERGSTGLCGFASEDLSE